MALLQQQWLHAEPHVACECMFMLAQLAGENGTQPYAVQGSWVVATAQDLMTSILLDVRGLLYAWVNMLTKLLLTK